MRLHIGDRIGADVSVMYLSGVSYRVTGSNGDFVVRFPVDGDHLSLLKKEESVQRGLRDSVTLRIPDTSVIDGLPGVPVFAIHEMIPGQPLTTDAYVSLSRAGRDRLVRDLVNFFRETHNIPLRIACEWFDIPFDGHRTATMLAAAQGKPLWFDPGSVAELRPSLAPILDAHEAALFEGTVTRFEELGTDPGDMVFGHGDMHGYNMAMGEDRLGPRLVGAFDLGCTGILDVHEDFFRLSLISEDLLNRVIETYQSQAGQTRSLDRDRIAIYYRAFLFYLMAEKSGESLHDLKTLLYMHVEDYDL